MRIRLKNAKILTMENTDIFDGEIWINNSVIDYVGSDVQNCDVPFDKEIDCHRNLLMPGFKNAHTHTAMTFSRSLADDYELNDWLFKAIFPREAKLTPEHIYWFTKLGFAEYLRNGTTACFDMYFHPDAVSKAAVETGFRNVFCCSVNDFGGIDRLEDEYQRYNNYDELVSYQLGFHAEYTTSEELMKRISDYAHKYEAPIFAHISETKSEVEGCIERYGITPAVLFDKLGLYDFGGGGFHCVWFNEEDFEVYKKRNLTAVFNACSNLKLASGIAPVTKFIDKDISIALGTDGAGSNNSLNMFREMYLCSVLSNVVNERAASVKPTDILKAATVGGAHAMGIDSCDVLAVGKNADIIMIDLDSPNMHPVNNTPYNLVYSGDTSNVLLTMINGKVLYENGNYTTIDINEVYSECNKLMKGLYDV